MYFVKTYLKYIIILCLFLFIIFLYRKNKLKKITENYTECQYDIINNIISMFTNTQINPFFPSTGIIAWSGTIASIPSGWVLCDGKNNTPNLSGRFILGYDATKYPLTLPGFNSNTGGTTSHVLTYDQMPGHIHDLPTIIQNTRNKSCTRDSGSRGGSGYPCRVGYGFGFTPITTSAIGGSGFHNNMPPYFVLAYIMKK
jgi:microcystin-dependent protein